MKVDSVGFRADVQRAYSDFNEADYDAPFDQMPKAAQAALAKFADPDMDVAEFATKTVDGRRTFAAFVPSDDVQLLRVVSSAGTTIANGENLPEGGSVSWS
jgi:hypothetical protein